MAFPQVAATNNSVSADEATTHTISLPSGIVANSLVLVFVATDGDISWSNLNGFTQLKVINNGTAASVSVMYKYCAGGETTVDFISNENEQSAHISCRITGDAGSGTIPQVSTGTTGTTTTPDPDLLTPTGGAKDYLWFAACGCDDDDGLSGYPLPDNNTYKISNTGNGTCQLGICSDELNQAELDPETFTTATAEQWAACTVAVHPVGATIYPITKTDSLVNMYELIGKKQIGIKQDSILPSDNILKLLLNLLPDTLIGLDDLLKIITSVDELSKNILTEDDIELLTESGENLLTEGVGVLYEKTGTDTLLSILEQELKQIFRIETSQINNLYDTFSKYLIRGIIKEDNIILSDVFSDQLIKLIAEGLVISDAYNKQITKFITDSINLSDDSKKYLLKIFIDNINLSDISIKELTKSIVDNINLSDDSKKYLLKIFIDNINLSDDYIAQIVGILIKVLQDSFLLDDLLKKGLVKTYSELVIIFDNFINILICTRAVADSLSILDDRITQLHKVTIDELAAINDALIKNTFKNLQGDLLLSDDFYKESLKLIADSLNNLVDSFVQVSIRIRSLLDQISIPTDISYKKITRIISDNISILSDFIISSGLIFKLFVEYLFIDDVDKKDLSKTVDNSIVNLTDLSLSTRNKLVTDILDVMDVTSKLITLNKIEVVGNLTGIVSKVLNSIESEKINLSDTQIKKLIKLLSNDIFLLEGFNRQLIKLVAENDIILSDISSRQLFSLVIDNIGVISELFLKHQSQSIGDILIGLEEVFAKTLNKIRIDDSVISDSYKVDIIIIIEIVTKLLQDSVLLNDVFNKNLTKVQLESFGIFDDHTEEIIKIVGPLLYLLSGIEDYLGKSSGIEDYLGKSSGIEDYLGKSSGIEGH